MHRKSGLAAQDSNLCILESKAGGLGREASLGYLGRHGLKREKLHPDGLTCWTLAPATFSHVLHILTQGWANLSNTKKAYFYNKINTFYLHMIVYIWA